MIERPEIKEIAEKRPLIVGFVGCLAGGKTTLAGELGKRWGIVSVEEDYPSNPFLEKFYHDPPEYSFKSQLFFLLSKIDQLKSFDGTKAGLIDPSLPMDFLYAQTHHKMGWMNDSEWNLYQNLFYTLSGKNNLPYPDIHIVVVADDGDLKKRIIKRGRPYELWILKNYPDYLSKLSDSVADWAVNSAKKENIFIANTSGDDEAGSVKQLADRIESHICAKFGLNGQFVLPKISPPEVRAHDTFPGAGSESLRFSR